MITSHQNYIKKKKLKSINFMPFQLKTVSKPLLKTDNPQKQTL
jgi:hypothetical protein